MADLGTCPECGHPLREREGRYGPFIGCSGYPNCKYVRKERREPTDAPAPSAPSPSAVPSSKPVTTLVCPACGSHLIVREP